MINYNYLSCTDYDGKTKEINFCSENLPESASADCTYLALHTDNNDPNILHIKKVSADDLKKELVFPSTTQIYKELNDSIITVSTNLSAALDTAVENSEKKLNAVVEQLPKLYTGILEIAGANVTPNENFGWGASTFTFSLNAQVFYGKEL